MEAEPEEVIIYKYIPPEPKDWISFGSEKEIAEESLVTNRPLVKYSVKRKRREFGAYIELADNVPLKDGSQECAPYEDTTFSLERMEMDIATQAVPETRTYHTQTDWKYPRNAVTQCEPRTMSEEEAEKVCAENQETILDFINGAIPRVELAVQQNNIMDVFQDDWATLGESDGTFGSKADNHLKVKQ